MRSSQWMPGGLLVAEGEGQGPPGEQPKSTALGTQSIGKPARDSVEQGDGGRAGRSVVLESLVIIQLSRMA